MATLEVPIPVVPIEPKVDKEHPMKCVEWHGKKSVRVNTARPSPLITHPGDAIIRVTSTSICGSDLHLFLGFMPGMKAGDIVGHEFMGVVHDVGDDVKGFGKGDRVVAAFDIACGDCFFCNKLKLFTCCDRTNPSKEEEKLYGDRTAGFFGYSHLTGGWPGGQAEYVRVPLADMNLLKVPEDMPDEKLLFLSDILPTAWHANELGEVGPGDNVAIWGAGPVGILSAHVANFRGAGNVFLIDEFDYRLEHAKSRMPFVKPINFKKEKVYDIIRKDLPYGPDVGIDAVGMHYAHSMLNRMEIAVGLETDTPEVLNEIIYTVRKGGRISIIGAYGGYVNHLNVGAFMEKSLTMRGGQTPCQSYWPKLLEMVKNGELDPTIVVTHEGSLEQSTHFYQIFNDKQDGCIKVVMHP
ncbi:hypothetical protein KP509_39G035700 [Ceratopteris richardii]|uniref:Alcohol dehydrogenase-like N-terminal domain-containing protein n=1 Tax=Ceratopteris richardii TaxID=49495 RepID=A0A8T2PZQ7_CERRI|nr:hypothetical protein KP509_39G035700 [Ceratopteris richardii]